MTPIVVADFDGPEAIYSHRLSIPYLPSPGISCRGSRDCGDRPRGCDHDRDVGDAIAIHIKRTCTRAGHKQSQHDDFDQKQWTDKKINS